MKKRETQSIAVFGSHELGLLRVTCIWLAMVRSLRVATKTAGVLLWCDGHPKRPPGGSAAAHNPHHAGTSTDCSSISIPQAFDALPRQERPAQNYVVRDRKEACKSWPAISHCAERGRSTPSWPGLVWFAGLGETPESPALCLGAALSLTSRRTEARRSQHFWTWWGSRDPLAFFPSREVGPHGRPGHAGSGPAVSPGVWSPGVNQVSVNGRAFL